MENGRFTCRLRAAVAPLLGLVLSWALMACGGGGSSQGAADATLTWTGAASDAVTGYRVYYGLAPRSYVQARGAGIAVGSVETYVVTGLSAGNHYYFAVTRGRCER